ncbi:hypothetical protein C0991_008116 [Blastosporella zonata]|nr:hypothetical protein C0991_008116 [Blastosporella zonata]
MSPSVSVASDKNGTQELDIEREASIPVPVHPSRSTFKSIVLVVTCTFAMVVNVGLPPVKSANNTSVSISLSTVGRDLHIDENQLEWLVSAYPLSSGCLLLVCGRLADLYGRKKTFVVGSTLLAAFTLGCGFAQDSLTLDILRGFQGIGAAATIPASLGILAHAFPPSRARSIAFSTFAAGAPVGAAFGMALGGVLTQVTKPTWRSPFFFEAGLTVLCLIGGIISFDADLPSQEVDRRVDWLGALLVTAGLVLIVFVLGQGEIAPQQWKTPYIIALLIVGVLLIVVFLFWQLHLERVQEQREEHFKLGDDADASELSINTLSWLSPPPLMKVSLWARAKGRFAVMMCIAFMTWCSFLSWNFWAQLYYQNYHGYTPILTVIRFLPMFVSGIICNMVVAAIISYIPILYLIAFGTMGTSIAALLFAVIDPNATYWAFGFPAAVISVFGADFVFASGTLFIAKVAQPHEQSLAGALFQTMTQLGTSLGVTVTTVIFNRITLQQTGSSVGTPPLLSYQAAQWGAFAFGVLSMALAIVFFRGVGIVGHRKSDVIQQNNAEDEQEKTATSQEKKVDNDA